MKKPIVLFAANYFVLQLSVYFIYFFESYFLTKALVFRLFSGLFFVLSFFALTKAGNLTGTVLLPVSSGSSVIVTLLILNVFLKKYQQTIKFQLFCSR